VSMRSWHALSIYFVAKAAVIRVNTRHTLVQLDEIKLNQMNISSPPISNLGGDILTTSASHQSNNSKVEIHTTTGIIAPKPRRRWNCAERQCSCSCHRTIRTTGRFVQFEYTPLDVFRQTCDQKSCNVTKYGGKFSFALSQFGIRWCAIIQFHVLAAPGKVLFRPAFEVERIVPYTSPGFEILWRCKHDLISVDEAQDRLVILYRSDPTFKNHVDPSGMSYIEVKLSTLLT